VLRRLAAGPEPLVVELPRQGGHKENRWMHLVSGVPAVPTSATPLPVPVAAAGGLADRVARLEAELTRLRADLEALGELVTAKG
jgi:hypothetical protein